MKVVERINLLFFLGEVDKIKHIFLSFLYSLIYFFHKLVDYIYSNIIFYIYL